MKLALALVLLVACKKSDPEPPPAPTPEPAPAAEPTTMSMTPSKQAVESAVKSLPDAAVAAPTGRVHVGSKTALDTSSLTAEVFLAKMMIYMPGVERCYTERLAAAPTLSGEVTLALTVTETGRSSTPEVSVADKELASCIAGLSTGWRFPVPKNAGGDPVRARFQLGLVLLPD